MTENNKDRYQTYSEVKKTYLHNLIKKIIISARERFFIKLKNLTNYNLNNSVLDIGTTPSTDIEQNIFLENTKDNLNITCISNQDCSLLKKKYPNVKDFKIGDLTKFISEGRNELIMVPVIIIIIELIIRNRPSPGSSLFNFWSIIDKARIGATYAIILEAFKLGS